MLKHFIRSVNIGFILIIGIICGFIRAIQSIFFNKINLNLGEHIIFLLYFIIILSFLILILYILLAMFTYLFSKLINKASLHNKINYIFLFILMFFSLFVNSKWSSVYYNHYEKINTVMGGELVYVSKIFIIIAISFLFAFSLNLLLKVYAKLSKNIKILLTVSLFLIMTFAGFFFIGISPGGKESEIVNISRYPNYTRSPNKIFLLCADGASWNVIDELIKQGELPNISFLMKNGTYSILKSLPWSVTLRVWPTIATGKLPSKHGILGFTKLYFKGLSNGFYAPMGTGLNAIFMKIANATNLIAVKLPTTYDLRASPIWEILSNFNYRVGVVRWVPSWPSKQLNGRIVSKGAFDFIKKETMRLKQHEELAKSFFYPYDDFIFNNNWNLESKDKFYFQVAENMFHQEEYDFFMLGLNINDSPQHAYYKYYKPEYFLFVKNRDILLYENKIPDSYRLLDKYINEIIKWLPSDYILIIVSDHGATPVLGDFRHKGGGSHIFDTDGIFIAYGKGIKSGFQTENIAVEDIVPIILRIYHLPIANDMDGNPADEIFTTEFIKTLKEYPHISTYELKNSDEQKKEYVFPFTKEEIKKLKALGYIN